MREDMRTVESLCPICGAPVAAAYASKEGETVFEKTCPEHGTFYSKIAERNEDYIKWVDRQTINIPPKRAIVKGANLSATGGKSQCPLHCGTCENHLQTACCVLIDVTKRCNQHCPYCFACAEEDDSQDLSLEQIETKYDLLLELGEERPFNIQLSGGEPTVRDDLPEIVKMGKDKGFEYIQINTNGKRLAQDKGYVKKLQEAGASVIYLQFDGTRDDIYQALRNEPLLQTKKKAIENCRKAGLPVVLVPTIVKSVNLNNIGEMFSFLLENLSVVKGIHFQPVSFFGRYPKEDRADGGDFADRVTMFHVMHEIERQTGGLVKYDDLCPITTGHTLCCFCGTFMKNLSGEVESMISEETKAGGMSCCGAASPLSVIKKDRDFVLNKWQVAGDEVGEGCCGDSKEEACCCCGQEEKIMSFDEMIVFLRSNLFTISGMAFMDKMNLDGERLKRCRVQQLTDDNRLIPFCAYNNFYR